MTSNQHFIAIFSTSIFSFLLGFFVLFKGIRKRVNQIFALYSFSIAIWSLGQALHSIAPDLKICLFWARFSHLGVVFIPTFFVHFVFEFLGIIKEKRKILILAYVFSIFFTYFNLFTNLYIPTAVPKFSLKFYIKPGVLYLPSVIFFVLFIAIGLIELFREYFKSSGAKRNQMKYLCWSTLFGYLGGAPNFLLTFDILIYPLNPFGTYFVSLYVLITVYAILKYRLMDITVLAVRTLIFTVVYLLVLGIPFWFGIKTGLWIYSTIIMAVLATTGPFIYIFLQRRAESRLLAKKRARQDKLRELSSYMMRFTRLKLLANLIVHNVLKILQLKHTALYLLEVDPNKTKQYNLICSYGMPQKQALPLSISLDSALAIELTNGKTAIESERIKHKATTANNHNSFRYLLEELDLLRAHIVIPTFLRFNLMGFLILGESRSQEAFTQEDINVLQVLSNQAALAIENALFWQRDEEKLVESSKEEAASAVSFGAGHQFNNRLYAISMTVDGIFDVLGGRDINQLSPDETKTILQKALVKLKKISEECQFGGQITAGIMSLTGTAPPNFAEFDISPIVTSSIELVEMKHSRDKIEGNKPSVLITNNTSQNLPPVFGSDAQIRDCLFNLIDNAYDAAYEKDSQIKKKDPEVNWPQGQTYTPQIEIKTSVKDNNLVIHITDNGIGIKEENKKRLFAGFFTTKATSIKGYGPGGHGIGVFTVKKLILAHKGKIYFNSEYGKGTTFTIELPLAKKGNSY